jgi:hypothetical protein
MNKDQELRGELRELLSQALVIAAGALKNKDQALENYELGKAAGYRAALALINKGE